MTYLTILGYDAASESMRINVPDRSRQTLMKDKDAMEGMKEMMEGMGDIGLGGDMAGLESLAGMEGVDPEVLKAASEKMASGDMPSPEELKSEIANFKQMVDSGTITDAEVEEPFQVNLCSSLCCSDK